MSRKATYSSIVAKRSNKLRVFGLADFVVESRPYESLSRIRIFQKRAKRIVFTIKPAGDRQGHFCAKSTDSMEQEDIIPQKYWDELLDQAFEAINGDDYEFPTFQSGFDAPELWAMFDLQQGILE